MVYFLRYRGTTSAPILTSSPHSVVLPFNLWSAAVLDGGPGKAPTHHPIVPTLRAFHFPPLFVGVGLLSTPGDEIHKLLESVTIYTQSLSSQQVPKALPRSLGHGEIIVFREQQNLVTGDEKISDKQLHSWIWGLFVSNSSYFPPPLCSVFSPCCAPHTVHPHTYSHRKTWTYSEACTNIHTTRRPWLQQRLHCDPPP